MMKVTEQQLRRIIREALVEMKDRRPEEEGSGDQVPDEIQKKVDQLTKSGVPAAATKDPDTGEWTVEEYQ